VYVMLGQASYPRQAIQTAPGYVVVICAEAHSLNESTRWVPEHHRYSTNLERVTTSRSRCYAS